MSMTIGQIAKQTGLSVEAIRYYEKEALITPPARSSAGYRIYPPEVVKRVHFIKQAKAVGFSLKEIRELLSLKASESTCCGDIRNVTLEKIAQIENKISELETMRNLLSNLATRCENESASNLSDCPILDSLDRELVTTTHD